MSTKISVGQDKSSAVTRPVSDHCLQGKAEWSKGASGGPENRRTPYKLKGSH